MKAALLFSCIFLISYSIKAQVPDTVLFSRDSYGDLNQDMIKKGEMKGSILLPGLKISLGIGGFIKATSFIDTKYSRKDEILLPGTYSAANIDDGQFYLGARSSRLYFDGRATTEKGTKVKAYIEMDFRGSSGITLRHAYLQLTNTKKQSLLMGQYWSNVMDLQSIPEGLVEATVSGAAFSRHGQVKVGQEISSKTNISFSVEESSSTDFSGVPFTAYNKVPDFTGAIHLNPSSFVHFSASGLLRFPKLKDNSTLKSTTQTGYLTTASMVLRNTSTKFILTGVYVSAAASYILGADPFSSGYFSGNEIEAQNHFGWASSIRHVWDEKFRSNIAFGMTKGNNVSSNPGIYFKNSQYFFVNTFYRLNEYINMGVEWIYTSKKNTAGPAFNNNRFEFGIQVF